MLVCNDALTANVIKVMHQSKRLVWCPMIGVQAWASQCAGKHTLIYSPSMIVQIRFIVL